MDACRRNAEGRLGPEQLRRMHGAKGGITRHMDQVATAAVSHRPEQRPAGVGGRIPRVDIAADLAPDEPRMPTAAHQAAPEDPRIAPPPTIGRASCRERVCQYV